MKKSHNYYRVLHVQPDAPDLVIKASYRTLMQRLHMHPDLGGDHARAALINEAFRTLGDPVRRARYDKLLEGIDTPHVEPPAPEAADADAECPFCFETHRRIDAERADGVCAACGAALYPAERHVHDGSSRRAIDRLPRNMRVTFVRASSPRTPCKAVTQDLSLNGMRFLTHIHLTLDERLIVESDFCSAVAIVRSVRAHAVDPSGWECGVEFLTMRVRHHRGGLISTVT
jgi:curved DNA-binding protein CbpA